MFTQEFLRNINFKAKLIRKAENLRKTDNVKYSLIVDKYKAGHKKLNMLPVEKLRDLVSEF